MKHKKSVILFGFVILLTVLSAENISAAPYYSYMLDRDGYFRYSPTLYEPSRILNFEVNGVNDMYIDANDLVYIARTGQEASEVLMFDAEDAFLGSVGGDVLRGASGVFVDGDGRIYVADNMQSTVFVFSRNGALLQKIERPVSPLFGTKTPFKPVKLAVDKQKNIYILSEGTTNGIIQLDSEGEFLGYFAVSTVEISLARRLQNLIFSPEMMANFIRAQPSSMTNIAIDGDGLVYATTRGDTKEPLKKINIAGKNLLDDSLLYLYGNTSLLALETVTTDQYGNIYTVSAVTGNIIILDSLGQIIGLFGAKSDQNAELGITANPVAISINTKQTIYIADKAAGQIQVFTPSPLMWNLFSALSLYKEGRYIESEELWRNCLKQNSTVAIANNAIGLSLLKKEEYSGALGYFRLANNRDSYSTAFWEVRQKFLMAGMQYVILAIIALMVFSLLWSQIKKRTTYLDGYYAAKKRLGDTLALRKVREVTKVFRHPVDAYYDLSHDGAVPLPAALALTIAAAAFLLVSDYATGFVFNTVNTSAGYMYSPLRVALVYVLGFALFVLSNFLIASIKDGRGSFLQIFRAASLALAPIAFFYIPLILLSNILTLQETFIFSLAKAVIFSWSGLLVIIMVMQIHDYDFREALLCLVLTVFAMAVIFIVCIVIYILGKAAVDFFISLIEEMFNHA
ncbi:hypothetical protein FACS1894147_01350 [Spirochaetia bacterium]|nr:hypothetical protein FACS1894147_01350 [Spirochaetia bacterium]